MFTRIVSAGLSLTWLTALLFLHHPGRSPVAAPPPFWTGTSKGAADGMRQSRIPRFAIRDGGGMLHETSLERGGETVCGDREYPEIHFNYMDGDILYKPPG